LSLWGLLCHGFLLSWQFWQGCAALPKKYPEDHQSPGFGPNVFFFLWQIAHYLWFKMNLQKLIQDLNPECKEDSSPIIQVGVKLGL